jgi:hypothetical protein
MGDIVSQDKAYTIKVLHKLLSENKQEWMAHDLNMEMEAIRACMFLLVSSLGGMRGFKVMWTDLAALRYDLHCSVLPILGHFKGQDGKLQCYMIAQ